MGRTAMIRRTSVRTVGAAALTVFVLGVVALPATAVPAVLAAVTPLSVHQGGTVTISGTIGGGCPTGDPIQLISTPPNGGANLFPNGQGPQAPRDAGGNFKATFVVPASTPVGSYGIAIRCGGTTGPVTAEIDVTAGPRVAPTIKVTPTSAQPGASVTISGLVPTTGSVFCPVGDAAQLTSTAALFPPDGFGPQVTRDANGNFTTSYTIPATTTVGTYSISARCGGGNIGVLASLQVTATGVTTTTVPSTTTVAPTTTTVPSTSTSSAGTTVAPTTTAPGATTTVPAGHGKSKSTSPLRWIAIGVLVLVVIALALLLSALRRRAKRRN